MSKNTQLNAQLAHTPADELSQVSAWQRGQSSAYATSRWLIFGLFAALWVGCEDELPQLKLSVATSGEATISTPLEVIATASESGARFSWRLIEQPLGVPSTLELREVDPRTPKESSATLTPQTRGVYQIEVSANRVNPDSDNPARDRATQLIEVDVRCAPPRWSIATSDSATSADNAESAQVGVEVAVEAQLTAQLEDGCPEVDPPPYQLSWTWRAWPLSDAGQAAPPRLERLSDRHVRFTPSARGAYVLHIAARDELNRVSEAEHRVAVECGAQAPTVEARVTAGSTSEPAGADAPRAVTLGAPVQVSLSGSDPDASCATTAQRPLSFSWRWQVKPAGSQALLDDRGQGIAGFTPDVVGIYTLIGEAVDGEGLSATTTLTFEADVCGARAPVINALSATPERVDLGGSTLLSVDWGDPDLAAECADRLLGDTAEQISFSWRVESAPAGSIAQTTTPAQPTATFTPDVAGQYTLSVEVSDTQGHITRGALDLEVSECELRRLLVDATSSADEVTRSSLVTLSASASLSAASEACTVDAEPALEASYEWRVLNLPPGATGLTTRDRPVVTWRADVAGLYVFEVVARDSRGRESAPRRVEVSVIECGATPPSLGELTLEGDLAIGAEVTFGVPVSDADTVCGATERYRYDWRLVARPAQSSAELPESERARPHPSLSLDRSGEYRVEVEVTDDSGLSSSAQLSFSVEVCGEGLPVVDLTVSDESPTVGESVTLRAAASDPDSAPPCERAESFTYEWRAEALPLGYEAPLALTGAAPQLLVERAGVYRFSVTAIDAAGHRSAPDSLELEVASCGDRPPQLDQLTAEPSPARLGVPTRLSAQVTDPDAECGLDLSASARVEWRLVSAPRGSEATLSGGQTPSFTPDQPGVYIARALATTSDGLMSSPAELSVEVNGCGGAAPEVSSLIADLAQARVGDLVTFTGASADADRDAPCALEDPHQYTWQLRARPAGSEAALSVVAQPSAGDTQAQLRVDREGDYQVELVAMDTRGMRDRADVSVSAAQCGATAPQLNAISVSPLATFVGRAVTLSGAATPPDADCVDDPSLMWRWSITARPLGSVAVLSSTSAAQPSFTPDRAGVYRFQAQVISAGELSETRQVELTVQECGAAAPVITQLNAPNPADPLILGEPVALSVDALDPDEACGLAQGYTARWVLRDAPAGSAAVTQTESALSASLMPDLPGVYTVSVYLVEDETGLTSLTEEVVLFAGACGGLDPEALVGVSAPDALAPADQIAINAYTCLETPFIQLDASASVDPNAGQCGVGGELTYQWSVRQVSAGVNVYVQGTEREAVNLSLDGLDIDEIGSAEVEVEVTNERGLTDRAYATVNTRRLPSPDAAQVVPDLFCAGAREVTIVGSGFIGVGDAYPEVLFGGLTLTAHALEGCSAIPDSEIRVCTSLKVNLPDGLRADLYKPQVTNPYPLGCTDAETLASALLISAPRVDEAAPDPICRGQFTGELTLSGAGFLSQNGGDQARVSVNGIVIPLPQLGACADVAAGLESCAEARFDLPPSESDEPVLSITVSNPPTAGCDPAELSASFDLIQSEPPQIDDVQPRKICDQGGTLTLTGDHFEPNMTVELGPYRADEVINTRGELEADAIWTRREQPRFDPGLYLVTARNASGCEETFAEEIRVTEGPVPFFVDPPVVYSGVNLQATAYLGNLFGGSVSKVEIQSGDAEPIELSFSADADKPSVIKLFLPQGLPDGLYDLTLYDEVDCPGTTPALLRVTSDLSVNITEISPPFAWNQSPTSVTVFADPNAGFIPTPRSYLSPTTVNECNADADCGGDLCRNGRCVAECVVGADTCPGGSACVDGACLPQAAELRAASLNSISELKGVVAEGFSPGEYDLIVVNPNGQVGLLERALRVNRLPPPKIDGVSPGSWELNNDALPVQVSGANFRDASVLVTCLDGAQQPTPPVQVQAQDGALLSLVINTNGLSSTAVCSLRVTNSDAAYADFSPLTTVNPSGNFVKFSLSVPLQANQARRLSALTYAQVPNGPPQLYLFGGDKGGDNLGLNDNLKIGIDAFGNLQSWTTLPTTLPSRLTRIEANTIGRFIYIAGGFNSDINAPTDEIIRAEILDPLYVPVVDQVDFEFDENIEGLDTGVYYYRVSAVYPADDPNNPNGESLSSEPQPVFIPDIPIGVRLILTWIGLPDASGYRVYRSPNPDLLFGEEELIAEVDAATLSWSDEGAAPISNKRTLNIGELGNWSTVARLAQPRVKHATVIAPDPDDDQLTHLYAIGGEVGGNTVSSVEVLSVDTSDSRAHVLSLNAGGSPGSRPTSTSLQLARSEVKAVKASAQEASRLPVGDVYLYALGGVTSNNNLDKQVEVAQVNPGGDLSVWTPTNDMKNASQGYSAAIANNTLLAICGSNGSASNNGSKGEVCGADCGSPELINQWSGLPPGKTGAQLCINAASTSARGFFYLIGGGDGTSAISSKVDVSLLGGTP